MRIISPFSTPAGITIRSSSSRFKMPSPRHVEHGVSGTSPLPLHLGHARAVVNAPKKVLRVSRISPRPLQEAQLIILVPGLAPDPPHSSHTPSFATKTRR